MKFKTIGKSLNELHAMYGEGNGGFLSHWWKDEAFADDRPEAGEYELLIEHKKFHGMTFAEQGKAMQEGFGFPHPAVLAEALLSHRKSNGQWLMPDWYSVTSAFDSGGDRVNVGYCAAAGVDVSSWLGAGRYGFVGVGACRKVGSLEPGKLDPLESPSVGARKMKGT